MESKKIIPENLTYYQFQKEIDYSIFLKIETDLLTSEIKEVFESLGFQTLEKEEFNKKNFKKYETKVLKITKASFKLAKQIKKSFMGMENFGNESITSHGNYDVYRYSDVGMMVFSHASSEWEMGLIDFENKSFGVKVMLTRFLSWALTPYGVLSFWAVPVEEGLVVMNLKESNAESVLVDLKNERIITQDGVKRLPGFLQVLRLDSTLRGESRQMSREELLSFLTTNNTFFTQGPMPLNLKNTLLEMIQFSEGLIYPRENFEPREQA
jgi:hypothetical protein